MPLMQSWVASANAPETDFPLNNLPYGVYDLGDELLFCGVAIGDRILNLTRLEEEGLLDLETGQFFGWGTWSVFMEAGQDAWDELRAWLMVMLREGSEAETALSKFLDAQADATMHLPFDIMEYTDFYASKHHASNVGTMFRGPENALPPNWLSIPIGYNGRASSVVVSGTDVVRPNGQLKGPNDDLPRFGPCARWDFELEI